MPTTSYGYDAAGRLTSIGYNDSAPGASFTYDRAGLTTGGVDAAGANAITHAGNGGQADTEYRHSEAPLISA